MIIAITVVLPAPVASFNARRESSGLASRFALSRCSKNHFPDFPIFGATSESKSMFQLRRLGKERTNIVELKLAPMLEKGRGFRAYCQSLGFESFRHWSTL
jgi:hypothetical protein